MSFMVRLSPFVLQDMNFRVIQQQVMMVMGIWCAILLLSLRLPVQQ